MGKEIATSIGVAAVAGLAYYGAETSKGEVNGEAAADKSEPHSEGIDESPKTAEESIKDLVRRFLQEDAEQQQLRYVFNEILSAEEGSHGHEDFNAAISGYAAFAALRKDEVLFLNKKNEPVGEPRRFVDFVDTKPNFTGAYKYSPGDEDKTGILTEVPTREWRQYVQAQLQAQHPNQEITHDLNTVHFFREAYKLGDSQLQQKIASGEIVSRNQVYEYRIQQSFPGANGQNRVEYLQNNVTFRSEVEEIPGVPGAEKVAVPPVVQAQLRRLLPGLFAQESGFREDAVNDTTNATGSGQFMPGTWERYTGTDKVSTNYVDQVEVLGPMISDVYDRVLDKIGEDVLAKLRSLFENEEAFLESLIVPATISGFHTGPDRIAEAVRRYTDSVQIADMPAGKDLFLAIAKYGSLSNEGLLSGFKEESQEYVTQVYAIASVLAEQYQQPDDQASQLAQN